MTAVDRDCATCCSVARMLYCTGVPSAASRTSTSGLKLARRLSALTLRSTVAALAASPQAPTKAPSTYSTRL